MARSLSTSSHPYKIYVHTYAHPQDDQSLESAVIKFKCNIKMSYVPDKRIESSSVTRAYIPRDNAWDEFEHPANNLTEYFLSTRMFSSNTIPFELRNLHWKQWLHGKESVVLMSIEGIVTSILQVCQSMISKEEARKSGRKKLCLLVFIKNEVIVPHDEYLAKLNEMQEAEKKKQVLQKVEDMIKLRAQGWNYPQSVLDEMNEAIRQAGLGNSINEVLDFARRCSVRESRRRAVVRLVPAAEEAIQALQKVPLISNEKEKCTICMEEMEKGYQVAQMPCLHLFHGHCIEPWLKTSHMCPVCRHKLKTDDSSTTKQHY